MSSAAALLTALGEFGARPAALSAPGRRGRMGLLKRAVACTRPAAARLGRRYSTALASDPNPHVASMPALPPARPSLATATFDWQDPLALSASLTDEEKAIFETARSFAQQELKPNVVEANRAGHFDRGIPIAAPTLTLALTPALTLTMSLTLALTTSLTLTLIPNSDPNQASCASSARWACSASRCRLSTAAVRSTPTRPTT